MYWPVVARYRPTMAQRQRQNTDIDLASPNRHVMLRCLVCRCTQSYLGELMTRPQTPHQQRAPHQTLRILFLFQLQAYDLCIVDVTNCFSVFFCRLYYHCRIFYILHYFSVDLEHFYINFNPEILCRISVHQRLGQTQDWLVKVGQSGCFGCLRYYETQ